MNESSFPPDSASSTLLLLQRMRDFDARLGRVENHLQLDRAEKPVEAASPSPFAPAVSPPHPKVANVADAVAATNRSDDFSPSIPAAPVFLLPERESEPAAPSETSTPAFSLGEWENLIGGKWALWIGSLCLFLAMASFLAYTWRSLPPAPPWAKVAMGLASGAALLVAGSWLRSRTQRFFSEGISGAGLSICYLSVWAGGQYFSVFSHAQSFLGMAILTALGVALALRTDALSLSVLSTLGGFLTPVLLQSSGGGGNAMPFLSYVAFLDAGILAVSLVKRWRGLVWLSFAGTILLIGGWTLGANIEAIRTAFFVFLSAYFLLFLGASSFYSLIRSEETAPEDLLLLFAATSFYALAGYALLAPVSGGFPSAFPLALAAFFGAMNVVVTRFSPRNLALRYSAGGLALLGVTVAIPLQWHHSAFTIGWICEAAILLFLGGRLGSPLLRRAGQIVWLLTAVPLLDDLTTSTTPDLGIFSAAAGPLAVCVVVSALLTWNARKNLETERDELEAFYAVFSTFGGAWWLGQEIFHFFELHHATNARHWTTNAHFTVAGALGLYALLAFTLGSKWRHETTRVCALILSVLAAIIAVATACFATFATHVPLWNPRFAAFAVVGAALSMLCRLLRREDEALSGFETRNAAAFTVATACFFLIAASLELGFGFSSARTFLGFERIAAMFFALSILWSLSATLLLFLGCRWRQESLRALAIAVGSCALFGLGWNSVASVSTGLPLLNARFAAFAVALISLHLSAISLRRNEGELSEGELSEGERRLPRVFQFLSLGLLLWALTQESTTLSHYSQGLLGPNWARWAQMLVSLVWSLFGAILLGSGIQRRDQGLRLAALGLLCATVLKVFLMDLGFLNGPARVFSLAGLGISLIFISFLYSRFGTEKVEAQTSVAP